MIFEEKFRITPSQRAKSRAFKWISPCFPALSGVSGVIRPVSQTPGRICGLLWQAYKDWHWQKPPEGVPYSWQCPCREAF